MDEESDVTDSNGNSQPPHGSQDLGSLLQIHNSLAADRKNLAEFNRISPESFDLSMKEVRTELDTLKKQFGPSSMTGIEDRLNGIYVIMHRMQNLLTSAERRDNEMSNFVGIQQMRMCNPALSSQFSRIQTRNNHDEDHRTGTPLSIKTMNDEAMSAFTFSRPPPSPHDQQIVQPMNEATSTADMAETEDLLRSLKFGDSSAKSAPRQSQQSTDASPCSRQDSSSSNKKPKIEKTSKAAFEIFPNASRNQLASVEDFNRFQILVDYAKKNGYRASDVEERDQILHRVFIEVHEAAGINLDLVEGGVTLCGGCRSTKPVFDFIVHMKECSGRRKERLMILRYDLFVVAQSFISFLNKNGANFPLPHLEVSYAARQAYIDGKLQLGVLCVDEKPTMHTANEWAPQSPKIEASTERVSASIVPFYSRPTPLNQLALEPPMEWAEAAPSPPEDSPPPSDVHSRRRRIMDEGTEEAMDTEEPVTKRPLLETRLFASASLLAARRRASSPTTDSPSLPLYMKKEWVKSAQSHPIAADEVRSRLEHYIQTSSRTSPSEEVRPTIEPDGKVERKPRVKKEPRHPSPVASQEERVKAEPSSPPPSPTATPMTPTSPALKKVKAEPPSEPARAPITESHPAEEPDRESPPQFRQRSHVMAKPLQAPEGIWEKYLEEPPASKEPKLEIKKEDPDEPGPPSDSDLIEKQNRDRDFGRTFPKKKK